MIAYETLELGQRIELGTYRFTADEIRRFALAWDPQPFHVDEAAAASGPYGVLIAPGWHIAAVMMKLLVARFSAWPRPDGAPAPDSISPGFEAMRWLRPVAAGDTLSYRVTVADKRPLASRPGWGLVTLLAEADNQAGVPAFSVRTLALCEMPDPA